MQKNRRPPRSPYDPAYRQRKRERKKEIETRVTHANIRIPRVVYARPPWLTHRDRGRRERGRDKEREGEK